jgi:phosphoglycolate phosphatase
MMNYDLAIFDMDGTLADSMPFFVAVQNQLAEQHGFKCIGADEIEVVRHFTPQQLLRHVGLPRWKLPFVAKSFMSLMKESTLPIALFDDIQEVLADLHRLGVVLALVTSNSEDNARKVLGAEIFGRFRFVDTGASMFGKTPRIRRALKACAVPAARAIYIGDQSTDGEAARKAGVAFGAVSWGYGAIESLMACRPAEVFATAREMRRIAGQRQD